MKKIKLFIFLGIVCMLSQVQGQEREYKTATAHLPVNKSTLEWDSRRIDVGTVALNVPIEVDFYFKNEGSEPVIIENIETSCGCTAAKSSQAPVLPGESSKVTVTYKGKKPGVFRKTIRIETSDDEYPTLLVLAGEVQ